MDAAVIGVPHEEFGEEVKAAVQLENRDHAGPRREHELIAYCRSRPAGIKRPATVDFEAELPRTPTGKRLKRLIEDRYRQGRESRLI